MVLKFWFIKKAKTSIPERRREEQVDRKYMFIFFSWSSLLKNEGHHLNPEKINPPEHLCPVVIKAEPDKVCLYPFWF